MKKQRVIGKITLIILILGIVLVFAFVNRFALNNILYSMEWPALFFMMFLYAVIPGAPAVLLRAKFGRGALAWIAAPAAVLAVVCAVIIIIGAEAAFDDTGWIFTFAQCALGSSVPALFCVAFFGLKREAWFALVPAFIYFLSFFIRHILLFGFSGALEFAQYFNLDFILYQNPDPFVLNSMLTLAFMSVIFIVWALLCIFVSRMVYGYIERLKEKKNKKPKRKRVGE